MNKVKPKWLGARIFFSFMDCPTCNTEISAPYCQEIENELRDSKILKEKVMHDSMINQSKLKKDLIVKPIVIKAYTQFKQRFEASIKRIMTKFDNDRKDELRFNAYW
jgi:hypothetical protein